MRLVYLIKIILFSLFNQTSYLIYPLAYKDILRYYYMLKKAYLGLQNVNKLIQGKQIVLRVDWNVPYKNNKVSDPTRVKSTS